MFKIFKKHSVSFLNENMEPIPSKITNLKFIPREGELIYMEDVKQYYKVLNIIYYLNKKQGIFILIEKFGEKIITHI